MEHALLMKTPYTTTKLQKSTTGGATTAFSRYTRNYLQLLCDMQRTLSPKLSFKIPKHNKMNRFPPFLFISPPVPD